MKSAFPLAAGLLLCTAACNLADTVQMNGITSLFGEKLAFMIIHQSGRSQPVSFILSEGQSQFGIKLLAVDIANCSARIEQSGKVRQVRLASAPIIAMPAALAEDAGQYPVPKQPNPQEQSQIQNFLNEDKDAQRIMSGNPVYLGAAAPANTGATKTSPAPSDAASGSDGLSDGTVANSNSADPGASQTDSSPDNTGAGSSSNSKTDYTSQYWYVTSLNIERNRLATANLVANGTMDPLPRTPLTPVGTPSSLVGSETFFPNQIPGFQYGGSVDD